MSEVKKKAIYSKTPVATGLGVLTYTHIDTPDNSTYGKGLFNATILHPLKDDAYKTLNKALREECIRIAKEAFPEEVVNGAIDAKKIEWPWRNGDKYPKREQHAGNSFMFAKQYPKRKDGTPNDPIAVLGPDGRSIISPKAIYWGCLGKLKVTPYSYSLEKKVTKVLPDGSEVEENRVIKGVALLLIGVQFVGDGQKFKGGNREVTFDAVEGYSAASTAPAAEVDF
jgi:hypothetical protein